MMTKKTIVNLALCGLAMLSGGTISAANADLAIVINIENSIDSLTPEQVADI